MKKPSVRVVALVHAIDMCFSVNLCLLLWPYRSATWFMFLIGGLVLASHYVAEYVAFPPRTRALAKTPITARGMVKAMAVGIIFPPLLLIVCLCSMYLLGPLGSLIYDAIVSMGRAGQMVLANLVAACLGGLFGMVRLRLMRRTTSASSDAMR